MSILFLNQLWELGEECFRDEGKHERYVLTIEDDNVVLGAKVLDGDPFWRNYIVRLPTDSKEEALYLVNAVINAANNLDLFWSYASRTILESAGFIEEPMRGVIGVYMGFNVENENTWLCEPIIKHDVNQLDLLRKAILLVGYEKNISLIVEGLLKLATKAQTPKFTSMLNHGAAIVKTAIPGTTPQDVISILVEAWRNGGRADYLMEETELMALRLGIPFTQNQRILFRLEKDMNANVELADYFVDGMK